MVISHINSDVINSISNGISSIVQSLLKNGRFGVGRGLIQLKHVQTGCVSTEKGQCGDRFTVTIPYAGRFLNWEVLFNHHYPDCPPDFIFGSADADFCPEIENIKSLVNWDPKDDEALIKVLQELFEEYKIYHLSLKDQNSRLQFEYGSLISDNFPHCDIEVHVSRISPYRFGQVNFLMKLPIDFEKIPSYLTKDSPGEDSAVLLVIFQAPDSGTCTPQLFLSPRIKHALGDINDLRIPSFPHQGCLLDYVPTVIELLTNKVKDVVTVYEKRKQFISALLKVFGSLLQYDNESFTTASFLMEWHDFFFMVTVDISTQFPIRQPVYTFQSIYHVTEDETPYLKVEKDYPYNPQLSPLDMATQARTYLLEHISEFQRSSVREGLLQQ